MESATAQAGNEQKLKSQGNCPLSPVFLAVQLVHVCFIWCRKIVLDPLEEVGCSGPLSK